MSTAPASLDPALDALLLRALSRLEATLQAEAPGLAAPLRTWQGTLARSADPADYFRQPIGFPLLQLPWWMAASLGWEGEAAAGFLGEVVYSTINGYYFIRLLDNVMDGHATVEAALLPAAALFHTEFQTPYQAAFDARHPFWGVYRQAWFGAAAAATQDAQLAAVDRAAFERFAARKVSAAQIPLAAVGWRAGQPERWPAWAAFVEAFGAWHQMWNDVFDWHKDLRLGTRTYFLSEAERRALPGESPAAWVMREGFDWGLATLHTALAAAQALAAPLHSPALLAYLARRGQLLEQQAADVRPSLQHLHRLALAMTP